MEAKVATQDKALNEFRTETVPLLKGQLNVSNNHLKSVSLRVCARACVCACVLITALALRRIRVVSEDGLFFFLLLLPQVSVSDTLAFLTFIFTT